MNVPTPRFNFIGKNECEKEGERERDRKSEALYYFIILPSERISSWKFFTKKENKTSRSVKNSSHT